MKGPHSGQNAAGGGLLVALIAYSIALAVFLFQVSLPFLASASYLASAKFRDVLAA